MTEADQLTITNLIIAITAYRQLQEPRRVMGLENLEPERARHATAMAEAEARLNSALTRAMALTNQATTTSLPLSIAYQVDNHLVTTMASNHPEPWGTRDERAPYISAWLHDLAFAVSDKGTKEAIEAFDTQADATTPKFNPQPQQVTNGLRDWHRLPMGDYHLSDYA